MNEKISTLGIIKYKNIVSSIARYGIFVVFGLIVVLFALSNERFFTVKNIFLILQQASPLGIAVVSTIYVLIIAGIDISVGRNMFFAATVVAYLITKTNILTLSIFGSGISFLIIYIITIMIGVLIGLINGIIVTKFKILPFIVTLATGGILRGFGLMISDSASLNVSKLGILSNGKIGPVPIVLILFIIIVIIFDYILRRTTFGRHLMAIGNSPEAARKTGINIDRNTIISYIICGGLGAIGGVLSAGQIGSVPLSFGEGNEFIVISAAVLGGASLFGGKGNILPGAITGIILITTIMNGLSMVNASPYVYTIVRAVIIFLAVMVDSINYKGELR